LQLLNSDSGLCGELAADDVRSEGGGRKLTDALRTGDARVEGDMAVARRFLSLFPLPPTVEKIPGS